MSCDNCYLVTWYFWNVFLPPSEIHNLSVPFTVITYEGGKLFPEKSDLFKPLNKFVLAFIAYWNLQWVIKNISLLTTPQHNNFNLKYTDKAIYSMRMLRYNYIFYAQLTQPQLEQWSRTKWRRRPETKRPTHWRNLHRARCRERFWTMAANWRTPTTAAPARRRPRRPRCRPQPSSSRCRPPQLPQRCRPPQLPQCCRPLQSPQHCHPPLLKPR